MPFPLVWLGAAAGAIALAVHRFRSEVDNKRVLIVGPHGAGKSRVQLLLTRGERSLRDLGVGGLSGTGSGGFTKETFDFVTKKVRMRDLKWRVSYVDSPSSNHDIDVFDWAGHLADVDVVLFVVDGSKLYAEDYRAMAELLAVTCRLNAEEATRWILVVTHADRLDVSPETVGDIGHQEIARVLDDPRPIFADLRDWPSAARVVRRVIEELK